MPATGKSSQGAWNTVIDGTEFTGKLIGAASDTRASGLEDEWILSQVIDGDGTIRMVTV